MQVCQAEIKPGTGTPLHTQEPVTVASFRTWRGWRENVARDRCLTPRILTFAARVTCPQWPLSAGASTPLFPYCPDLSNNDDLTAKAHVQHFYDRAVRPDPRALFPGWTLPHGPERVRHPSRNRTGRSPHRSPRHRRTRLSWFPAGPPACLRSL